MEIASRGRRTIRSDSTGRPRDRWGWPPPTPPIRPGPSSGGRCTRAPCRLCELAEHSPFVRAMSEMDRPASIDPKAGLFALQAKARGSLGPFRDRDRTAARSARSCRSCESTHLGRGSTARRLGPFSPAWPRPRHGRVPRFRLRQRSRLEGALSSLREHTMLARPIPARTQLAISETELALLYRGRRIPLNVSEKSRGDRRPAFVGGLTVPRWPKLQLHAPAKHRPHKAGSSSVKLIGALSPVSFGTCDRPAQYFLGTSPFTHLTGGHRSIYITHQVDYILTRLVLKKEY